MAIKTVADLKRELHKMGIKTYRNKKTQASYVKKEDVEKILAAKKPFVIYDWTGNKMFDGEEFKSFEDAEEFLTNYLNEHGDYEEDRQEYYIEPKDTRKGLRMPR